MMHSENLPPEAAVSEDDATLQAIWNSLTTVIDPEIGLDIVTLGLVYDIAVNESTAVITHTLTTPGCPMERIITEGIRAAVLLVDGIDSAQTVLVWDPAWHSGMIDPQAWGR
jgi:metal-sulfur cluster biosynthetic enzyme